MLVHRGRLRFPFFRYSGLSSIFFEDMLIHYLKQKNKQGHKRALWSDLGGEASFKVIGCLCPKWIHVWIFSVKSLYYAKRLFDGPLCYESLYTVYKYSGASVTHGPALIIAVAVESRGRRKSSLLTEWLNRTSLNETVAKEEVFVRRINRPAWRVGDYTPSHLQTWQKKKNGVAQCAGAFCHCVFYS